MKRLDRCAGGRLEPPLCEAAERDVTTEKSVRQHEPVQFDSRLRRATRRALKPLRVRDERQPCVVGTGTRGTRRHLVGRSEGARRRSERGRQGSDEHDRCEEDGSASDQAETRSRAARNRLEHLGRFPRVLESSCHAVAPPRRLLTVAVTA